jgi:putative aldouronate transport system substrate-binding protein
MKRALLLLLVLVFVFALFAGCKDKDTVIESPSASAPAATEEPSDTEAPEVTEEPSPYNFAIGKVALNDKGLPTEKYEYPLPLSTTDEVFTFWYTNYVESWIPNGDYPSSPLPVEIERQTGVHIEYLMIPSSTMVDNFAVRLASDDLADLSTGANFYYTGGNFRKAVEEEKFFINIYDYKDYCPNYLYEVTKDPSDSMTIDTIFVEPDLITSFYLLMTEGDSSGGMNYFIRGDRLEQFGISNEDIVTFQDWHDVLLRAKTEIPECTYPAYIYKTIELTNCWGPGYDTLAIIGNVGVNKFVIDGVPHFANTTQGDKNLISMIYQWYSEGLIHPDWSSFGSNADINAGVFDTMFMVAQMTDNGTAEHQAAVDTQSPNATRGWEPLVRPVQQEGQVLHLGGEKSRFKYGSYAIATRCENIPLLTTWVDWRYSDAGSFLLSYGVEGVSWEYNEEGLPQLTEMMYNDPEKNLTMLCTIYTASDLNDAALVDSYARYSFPNNNRAYVMQYWNNYPYDGAYSWPAGAKPSDEQSAELSTYTVDMSTYIEENFTAFIDGSKPLSEWDAYIQDLYDMGLQEVIDIYKTIYDDYMAAKAEG